MAGRTDTASRLIAASPADIYSALTDPDAVACWLPPTDMTGEILAFEPREGGEFHMELRYRNPEPGTRGKSGENVDIVRGRFVRLRPDSQIVQSFCFESDDPAFAGTMTMTWSLDPVAGDTRVTVRCENVPPGIDADDHAAGLGSSLENLGDYLATSRS